MAYPGDTHSITLAVLEEISTFIAEVANTKTVGNKRWVETKSMAALDIFADLREKTGMCFHHPKEIQGLAYARRVGKETP